MSRPITSSSLRLAQASPSWLARPAYAGRSRSVASVERKSSGLIIARSGPGTAGSLVASGRRRQGERKESAKPRRLNWLLAGVPSVPEIRQVLARLLLKAVPDVHFVLAWSRWRRHHQAGAAKAHYRSQQMQL